MKILVLSLILIISLGSFGKTQLKEIIDESQGLNNPFGVTFDKQGNTFIAEYEGGRIFKLDKSFEDHSYEVDLSTDDWPFLYMPKKIYPLTYLSIVSVYFLAITRE